MMIADSLGAVFFPMGPIMQASFNLMESNSDTGKKNLGVFSGGIEGVAGLLEHALASPDSKLELLSFNPDTKLSESKASYSSSDGLVVSPELVTGILHEHPQVDKMLTSGIESTLARDFQLSAEPPLEITPETFELGGIEDTAEVEEASLVPDDLALEELIDLKPISLDQTVSDLSFINAAISNQDKTQPIIDQGF
jgi:hypothetical protein